MDLLNELNQKCKELDTQVSNLKVTGSSFAKAERDYKVKLRQECLRLKEEGFAVTLIDKICYGIEEVAELRRQRDFAEVVYKANQESINSIKLQIRILQSQVDKEWGLTKNQ